MRFAITGYPRSGHAWLSNYFLRGSITVTHEGARYFLHDAASSRQAHVNLLRTVDGDCSSSWLIHPDLLRLVPKVVLIDRPCAEAEKRFRAALGLPVDESDAGFDLFREGFAEVRKHPDVFVVPYAQRFDLVAIERICKFIDEPFDVRRFALLRHLRVTQDVDGVAASLGVL